MTTTDTETETEIRPATSAEGLGELIRSHRIYIGLSQRSMAEHLGKARRDYQRIENDQDRCPPGLLTQIEQLTYEFDDEVDAVLAAATNEDGASLLVNAENEWTRLVAGRAAVLCTSNDITLTLEK